MQLFQTTLKCRLITPMFMAGADGREPELRPSEFKGMMRFWWRKAKAIKDIKELKKEETKIFGGSGEISQKSKVLLKIKSKFDPNYFIFGKEGVTIKEVYNLHFKYHKETRSLQGKDAGIGYLFYSTYLPGKERGFIKEGFEFELELCEWDKEQNEKLNKNPFLNFISALWLAVYLGGFGLRARARRGGGNLEIIEVKYKNKISKNVPLIFECEAIDKKELKKFLKENLEKIKEICQSSEKSSLFGTKIIIFDPQKTWIEALNFLGEEYQKFRISHKNKIFETAAFGMQVLHEKGKLRLVPYESDKLDERYRLSTRLASPLIFKVLKGKGGYFPIIVKLPQKDTPFIGLEEKKGKNWLPIKIKKFNEYLVEKFLENFKEKEELVVWRHT